MLYTHANGSDAQRYRNRHRCVFGSQGKQGINRWEDKQLTTWVWGWIEASHRVAAKACLSVVMPLASCTCPYSEDRWSPPLALVPTVLIHHLFLSEITFLPFQTEAGVWLWCMVLVQFSIHIYSSAVMFWLEFSHIHCEWTYKIWKYLSFFH